MLTRAKRKLQDINGELEVKGFSIRPNTFPCTPNVYATCRRHVDKHGHTIFNYNERNTQEDYKRSQAPLDVLYKKNHELRLFISRINKYLTRQFPDHCPNSWVVLKSSEGCQRQAIHTDYPLTNTTTKKITSSSPTTTAISTPTPTLEPTPTPTPVPLATKQNKIIPVNAIVALENQTQIHVWPASHRLLRHELTTNTTINKLTLNMSTGDLLLFRGDLLHCGSEYNNCSNIRLHCYLDCGFREDDRTYTMKDFYASFQNQILD